jgi:mRNA-degrading endonuclease RelE of RelBE toxin-antitoxin system
MSYKVTTIPNFDRQAKRLAKKQRSSGKEIGKLSVSLAADPTQGILLRERIFKVRMAIGSRGKGKSGGARVITYSYRYADEDDGEGLVARYLR